MMKNPSHNVEIRPAIFQQQAACQQQTTLNYLMISFQTNARNKQMLTFYPNGPGICRIPGQGTAAAIAPALNFLLK
jgi:hypothetical protein